MQPAAALAGRMKCRRFPTPGLTDMNQIFRNYFVCFYCHFCKISSQINEYKLFLYMIQCNELSMHYILHGTTLQKSCIMKYDRTNSHLNSYYNRVCYPLSHTTHPRRGSLMDYRCRLGNRDFFISSPLNALYFHLF